MGLRRRLVEFKPAILAYKVLSYFLFQGQVLIVELRERWNDTDSTHAPIPPARLRWRVHGALDKASYLELGRTLARNIQDLTSATGRDFSSFSDVLDFGSGCGRVIQNLRAQSQQCTLYATDIDPDLVSWGQSNLSGIQWSLNGHQPPLPYNANTFDLIYAVSVFTHLDEDFQFAWLRELQRVARPGAILILTVHGEHVMSGVQMLNQAHHHELETYGFSYLILSRGRFKADGFPDFYQAAFHTKEYIYQKWSAYFDVVDYVERGIGNRQDAVVLRKPLDGP